MNIRQRLLGYLARKSQEKKEGDKGFTLIELAIVIAVIAILIAVALPTFLGVQSSAHKSASEQNIVNSITSAKTYYATNQSSYTGLTSALMTGLEPSIVYASAATTAGTANQVAITVYDGQQVGFVEYTGGSDNECIVGLNIATAEGLGAGTWWSKTAVTPASGVCTLPVSAPTTVGTVWSNSAP